MPSTSPFSSLPSWRGTSQLNLCVGSLICTNECNQDGWMQTTELQDLRQLTELNLRVLDDWRKLFNGMPDRHKLKHENWKYRSLCRNPFRVILLRILPLLTASAGLLILITGCAGQFKSEQLRMVGVSMISISLFWFVWGNFIDFCVNGYGKTVRDDGHGRASVATHETQV